MSKKKFSLGKGSQQKGILTAKQKAIVLPAMLAVCGVAVAIAVFSIVIMPIVNKGSQRGVGADGFSAFQEKGASIGVEKIATKELITEVLGDKAKTVEEINASDVFNFNGDRSQTATFAFTRADGAKASLYIDMTKFKSATSMGSQHILAGTSLARIINGKSTYYMHAQTLGTMREYRIVLVDDLKAYKFVISQPSSNITISEVSAAAVLLKLAEKAQLQ